MVSPPLSLISKPVMEFDLAVLQLQSGSELRKSHTQPSKNEVSFDHVACIFP